MEQFFEKDGLGDWSAAKTRIYVGGPSGIVGVFNHDANLTDPTANTAQWLLTDHLGSTETVMELRGGMATVVQRLSFDPWGNRRDPATWVDYSDPSVVSTEYTDRGFTGHEMLDDTGLVHMNGRIYDPLLGRFLSADPHVQFPGDSQSYNRYSYVHNNPLKYSDPTGYFLDDLWDSISGFVKKYWRAIVTVIVVVVVAWFTAGLAAGWATSLGLEGIAAGAFAGAVSGAAAGFTGAFLGAALSGAGFGAAFNAGLTGAAWGAASGALAGGIGAHFGSDTQGFWAEAKRAGAHGVSGGIVDELRGGAFLAGAAAGFFSSAATHGLGIAEMDLYAGATMAATIGGTASVLGGGKFENGAMYAAFAYLYRNSSNKRAEDKSSKEDQTNLKENRTRIEVRAHKLGGLPGRLGFKHTYQVMIGSDGKEMYVLRGGPDVAYQGGTSDALTNRADGVSKLRVDVVRWEYSSERDYEYTVLNAYTVEGMPSDVYRTWTGYMDQINSRGLPYTPQGYNCNAVTFDSAKSLYNREIHGYFWGVPRNEL